MRRYYQQLEGGVLDPSRVATSVWDAITAILGGSRASLTAPPLARRAAPSPMFRAERLLDADTMASLALPAREQDAPDEVDALFLGEPEE